MPPWPQIPTTLVGTGPRVLIACVSDMTNAHSDLWMIQVVQPHPILHGYSV